MSGGGGTNTVTEKQGLPEWASPYLSYGVNQGDALGRQQLPVYQGQRTANLDPRQTQALDMITQRALTGSPVLNAAKQQALDTQSGKYLTSDGGRNPYTGLISGGTNPYAGSNPYIDNAIQSASNDLIRNYQTGTAAQLDKAAAQANAFGNSGYQQAVGQNQYALGQNLAAMTNNMRMADYTTQQQLAESGLNRNMQAQQANAQLADSQIARGMQMYNNERARQMQGMMYAPNIAQTDYADANALGAAGEVQRSYNQQVLGDKQQLWQEQAYEPYNRLQMYSQLTNPWWTGQNVNQKSSQYASNPYATALGMGQLGLGAYNAGLFNNLYGGSTIGTAAYAMPNYSAGLIGSSGAGAGDMADGTFAAYAGSSAAEEAAAAYAADLALLAAG